ncbi:MAG: hypothetical protein MZU95_10275 [Desulfomicrobium escambiense]|nr:hypothetical protein [Desulfomicrobium escambiense]
MVELLGVEMSLASDVASLDVEDWIVIVDGQKGNANIVDLGCVGVAVIDHHERCDTEVGSSAYRYSDIRPDNGSCSSMIAEYFLEAGEVPPRLVATALVYGIFIDTDNLTRGVSDLDAEMFWRLHSFADADLIRKLRGSQITLPRPRLGYAEAFRTVEAYGRIGFLRLEGADDSLVGAANDIVLSVDEVDASIAFSIRRRWRQGFCQEPRRRSTG